MPESYIFLMIFFVYSMILLFYGKTGYQEIETIDDFFTGGRKMGLFACVSTFVATWFSAASMQGLSGALYMYGYSFALYSIVPWFIGAYLLIKITPKLRASGAVTIPEYFYLRYQSKPLQVIGGLIVIFNFVLYMVIQIRGFGLVVSEFLDISYQMSIVLVYIFVLYTTFGGLFSITKSDGFNSLIIFTGVWVATVYIISQTGGIFQIHEKAKLIEGFGLAHNDYYTLKGSLTHPVAGGKMPLLSLISGFFGWGLGLAANPQYTVRIVAAKDDLTAKRMIKYSLVILTVIYAGVVLVGLGSRILVPMVSSVHSIDQIFPYVVHSKFPTVTGGIVLISIIAAAISTANSQLLVVSSSFIHDIFGVVSFKNASNEKLVFLSRLIIFLAGSVSLLLAISPPESLLVYGSYIWGGFSVAFLMPLYGGLFLKTASRKGAELSMLTGIVVMAILIFIQGGSEEIFSVNPAMYGVIASAAVFFLINYFERIKRL